MRSPVLFLVFNRPDTTQQVFEAIRAARPPKLYVAADGPRQNKAGEAELCEKVRKIATAIDWPCELNTLFRDSNLGCKLGVSSGITWFFDNEEEGIILEDDILPLPSFFDYCDDLLELYRHDEQVAMISGCNFISKYYKFQDSYAFSYVNHIWGWASWSRSWKNYDVEMKEWPSWHSRGGLRTIAQGRMYFLLYWREIFANAYAGHIDTWDYQWTFACWKSGGVTALPTTNLVYNLGFSENATHTTGETPSYLVESVTQDLVFPLKHPEGTEHNMDLDKEIDRRVFFSSPTTGIKLLLSSIPGLRRILSNMRRAFSHAKY